MRTERIGERLIVIEDCGERAVRLRDAIEAAAIPGVEEVVPCYESVGLIVDPERFAEPSLEALLRAPLPVSRSEPKRVEVPVCYELGEDLAEVCGILGLSSEEFISRHSNAEYRCFAVGFAPGFPYLGYVDPSLAGVPRLSSPRVRVPKGSVGIAGRQTGIYPDELPGGWRLIGRTPLEIVNLEEPSFLIAPGDSVVFVPIPLGRFEEIAGA